MRMRFKAKVYNPLTDGGRKARAYFAYAEFFIVLLLAISFGIALFFFIDHPQNATSQEIFISHFRKPFNHVNSLFDVLWAIIKMSLADIVQLLILYTFAYSRAFSIAAGGILVYRGVVFGYSTSYLGYMISTQECFLDNGMLLFALDIFIKLAVMNLLIWAASNLFADPIKSDTPSENAKLILSKSAICAISAGSVLILEALYSIILQVVCK